MKEIDRFLFITVEGIDGSGKDYQLLKLVEAIREEDNNIFGTKYDHIIIGREPTKLTKPGIRISEAIRGKSVTPEFAADNYIGDRQEHSQKHVKPNLEWAHFISSRYDISTLTYQMTQGMDLEKLYEKHEFEEGKCINPDYTIIFDLPAEVALKRINKRNDVRECFEQLEFLKEARKAHLIVADFLRQKGRNIIIVNADQSKEDVTKEMLEKISNNYNSTNNARKPNIYFAGSIRGGRDDTEIYYELIKHIQEHGNVLTEHVGDESLIKNSESGKTDKYIHDRDLEWLEKSDYVIAEVTNPSLGVGYEIAKAIQMGKKVLTLYRPSEDKSLSAMIAGADNIENREYSNLDEAKEIIDNFIKQKKSIKLNI